jgi:hypothetical protein
METWQRARRMRGVGCGVWGWGLCWLLLWRSSIADNRAAAAVRGGGGARAWCGGGVRGALQRLALATYTYHSRQTPGPRATFGKAGRAPPQCTGGRWAGGGERGLRPPGRGEITSHQSPGRPPAARPLSAGSGKLLGALCGLITARAPRATADAV